MTNIEIEQGQQPLNNSESADLVALVINGVFLAFGIMALLYAMTSEMPQAINPENPLFSGMWFGFIAAPNILPHVLMGMPMTFPAISPGHMALGVTLGLITGGLALVSLSLELIRAVLNVLALISGSLAGAFFSPKFSAPNAKDVEAPPLAPTYGGPGGH